MTIRGWERDERGAIAVWASISMMAFILCVGLGAVTTTLIAGVELAKRGEADPVGSLTQLARPASASAPRTTSPASRTSCR